MGTTSKSLECNNCLFKDFSEYWHYIKCLTKFQRDLVFASLLPKQQNILRASYNQGAWEDVIIRDNIDRILDHIKIEFGIDIILSRCKALKGKSVFLPRVVWEYLIKQLEGFAQSHKHYVLGGIFAVNCKSNNDVVLIVKSGSNVID